MLRAAILLGLLGLAAFTGILIWSGYAQVLDALGRAGWGILWTSLFHLVPMACCVIGWLALMTGRDRPSFGFLFYILWLRTSVNNLMPVARIGGELVAIRVMTKQGVDTTSAVASMMVELTLSIVAVFLFDVLGITLFALHVNDRNATLQLVFGLLFSLPVIVSFIFVQRAGFFGVMDKILTTMFRDLWTKLAIDTAQLDDAIHKMYRRRGRILYCAFWQFMSWVMGTGEVYLALHFLGHPLPLIQAFMLEALIQAASSMAFVVPGALGVQEAGILLFGHMLGLANDIAVALAVIRRCRDILLYIPGLIAWQLQEGRWLLGKRKA